jgi:transposase
MRCLDRLRHSPNLTMLRNTTVGPVSPETVRIARTALRVGNPYVQLRDQLGSVFDDEIFADLFPERGQPAAKPWRLALVTIMQFAEGMSDRTAADAVRARLDWKYLLGLELGDPGSTSQFSRAFATASSKVTQKVRFWTAFSKLAS